MTCRKGVWKLVSLTGLNLALVRQAFIELLLEELNYWKVSISDLNSLDIPLWEKGYGSWFEMLSLVSVTLYWAWVTLDTSLRLYSVMWQWANAFGSIRYASESVCDAYWTSMSILDFASHISDVCEAFYTIVSMWDTPALWGQCLRILSWLLDIWSGSLLCDLYIVRLSADVWLR